MPDRTDESLSDVTVSVVVPTWQRVRWLRTCLNALVTQERPPDEIVVVTRREDVETIIAVEQFAGKVRTPIRRGEVTAPGQIMAVKAGISVARGDLIAFADDDVEPQPDWLKMLLTVMEDPRVACCSGRVTPVGGAFPSNRRSGSVTWFGKPVGNVAARSDSDPIEVMAALDGNSIWRGHVLRRLRFDPRLAADDGMMHALDLAFQAAELGYRIMYWSQAEVIEHNAPRDPSLDRSDRSARLASFSRQYTLIGLRHFRGIRRYAFLIWWWLIGDRGSYGIMSAMWDLLARGSDVLPLISASFRGKWMGVRAYRGWT